MSDGFSMGESPGTGDETGPSAFLITKNRREKGIGGGSDVYAALMCQLASRPGMTPGSPARTV